MNSYPRVVWKIIYSAVSFLYNFALLQRMCLCLEEHVSEIIICG